MGDLQIKDIQESVKIALNFDAGFMFSCYFAVKYMKLFLICS